MNAYEATKSDLFKAPQLRPHLRMWKYQWIGIPLILIMPILAIMGVFGREIKNLNITGGGITAQIEYPSKIRYGQEEFIRVELTNDSSKTMRDVSVSFDKNYIQKFDGSEFKPQADINYFVKAGDISPGNKKILEVKLKAGERGSNSGKIIISSRNKEIISEELNTFIFP